MSKLLDLFKRAWEKRKARVADLEMFRFFDGSADGESDLYIDRIGPVCLAHILAEGGRAKALQGALSECAPELRQMTSASALYLRIHTRDPKGAAAAAILLHGESMPEAVAQERGLRYLIRPEANVNAGIFLDTRNLRAWLRTESKDLKVLNTFCFTGSLGIAAFAGGAREVVQVDSSKAALGWARENFELNKALAQGTMRFICDDCLTFMSREARRIKEGAQPYSLVILDPPSFGKSGKKVFSLRQDLPELVASACNILAPQAKLTLTCNTRSLSEQELAETCEEAVRSCGFTITEQATLHAPNEDFLARGADSIAMRGLVLLLKLA